MDISHAANKTYIEEQKILEEAFKMGIFPIPNTEKVYFETNMLKY